MTHLCPRVCSWHFPLPPGLGLGATFARLGFWFSEATGEQHPAWLLLSLGCFYEQKNENIFIRSVTIFSGLLPPQPGRCHVSGECQHLI